MPLSRFREMVHAQIPPGTQIRTSHVAQSCCMIMVVDRDSSFLCHLWIHGRCQKHSLDRKNERTNRATGSPKNKTAACPTPFTILKYAEEKIFAYILCPVTPHLALGFYHCTPGYMLGILWPRYIYCSVTFRCQTV